MSWEYCYLWWNEKKKKCMLKTTDKICPFLQIIEECKGWYVYEPEWLDKLEQNNFEEEIQEEEEE